MTGAQNRLQSLTKELRIEWENTKHSWNDAKSQEFEKQYLEELFAAVNHARIVTGVHGELLPNGGAMHLRLDPPELGDLLISVQMRDGVMTAAFQTSNDEATRLLSHSLGDLKATLEAQGVTVERLHVQQAPRQEQDQGGPGNRNDGRNPATEDQHHARREQQRREMVQRLWDKLAGRDAVNLTA